MANVEGFKILLEEVIANVVEIVSVRNGTWRWDWIAEIS